MPVKIDGKSFADHAAAVAYVKKNKPDVENPDAFVATIERKQTGRDKDVKKFAGIPLEQRSTIQVSSLVTGTLLFNPNDNIVITNVEIFLTGIEEPIAIVEPEIREFGASFSYVIDTRARTGEYQAVWNVVISGKVVKIINGFVIVDDAIDRTLPLELQHLR